MEIKTNQPIEVNVVQYHFLRVNLSGWIAHRHDKETGKYFIKAWYKSAIPHIKQFATSKTAMDYTPIHINPKWSKEEIILAVEEYNEALDELNSEKDNTIVKISELEETIESQRLDIVERDLKLEEFKTANLELSAELMNSSLRNMQMAAKIEALTKGLEDAVKWMDRCRVILQNGTTPGEWLILDTKSLADLLTK